MLDRLRKGIHTLHETWNTLPEVLENTSRVNDFIELIINQVQTNSNEEGVVDLTCEDKIIVVGGRFIEDVQYVVAGGVVHAVDLKRKELSVFYKNTDGDVWEEILKSEDEKGQIQKVKWAVIDNSFTSVK